MSLRKSFPRSISGAVLTIAFSAPGPGLAQTPSTPESFTLSIPRDAAMPPAELVSTENPSRAAILRHDIRASLRPEDGRLSVRDAIHVLHEPGTPGTVPISLLLWDGLEMRSVSADGVEVEALEPERMQPRSFWKRPPYKELGGYENARQIDLVLVAREGGRASVAPSWPETTVVTLTYEGVLVDSLQAPSAAYARSFETTAGLILPEGAFLAYSSFWLPTRPGEVFTFDLDVVTPPEWRAVSQGRMARDVVRGGQREMRWECPHPMEEVYLVAGPWEENHLRHGDVMAQTFTYANTDSTIYNRYLRGTGAYLDLYEEKIGPYPFAKFALVENFWQSGFGMPSFTLLGDRVIRLPFILDTSYGHEILHNWWGNGVFVDREGGNWCEGLTTYGADYFYEERKSAEAARSYRQNALQNYLDYVSEAEDLPLAAFRERHDFTSQAVGYSKSMMVVHQLRRAVGDDLFWKSLQDFYRRNLWRRASWTDLFESFAARGAVEPGVWRAQWIERTGAPVLRMEELSTVGRPGERAVQFALAQEAPDGGPPFALRVPIRILGEDGRQVDQELDVRAARTPVTVVCGFEPTLVEVDPDFHVLRRLHREEIPTRLSQVLGADSVAIVVADGLSPDLVDAFRELAGEWARGQRAGVFLESELPASAPVGSSEVAVWYLGRGARAGDVLYRAGLPVAEVSPMQMAGTDGATGAGNVAGVPTGGGAPDQGSAGGGDRATVPGGSGADAAPPSGEGAGTRWVVDGFTSPPGAALVVTGTIGDAPWGMLIATTPDDVAALGRKVPHYGKYSYLVFDQGDNVAKGIWPAGDSPLRRGL